MTTLKITSTKIRESLTIRTDLTNAASPVEVDYNPGTPDSEWTHTQYQAANCGHRGSRLADLGRELLADALQCNEGELGDVDVINLDLLES